MFMYIINSWYTRRCIVHCSVPSLVLYTFIHIIFCIIPLLKGEMNIYEIPWGSSFAIFHIYFNPATNCDCDIQQDHLFITVCVSVGVCLQLFLAHGLFYDLLKDNKLSKRKGSSYSGGYERRLKKKSEYVCSSSKYSQRTRRRYNCDEKTHKNYSAHSAGKTSQPCYDDNK